MKNIAIGLSMLWLSVLGARLYAESLSVEQALAQAKDSNRELQVAREELGVLKARVLRSGAIPNPEVGFSVEEVTRYEVGQTIEGFGKRRLRRTAAELDYEASRMRYQQLSRNIRQRVKAAYYSVFLAQERVRLAQDQQQLLQRSYARIEDKFRSGEVPLADRARAQVELQSIQNDVLQAKANAAESAAELNRMLGRPLTQPVDTVSSLSFSSSTLNTEDLVRRALRDRPDLIASQSEQKAAEAEKNLSRRQLYWPDLKAGLLTPKGEGRPGVGGRLAVEVPLWYQYGGERQSTDARLRVISARRADAESEIELEVFRAVNRVQLASAQVQLWQQSIQQASEALRLTQGRYEAGRADLLTFLLARKAYSDARNSYLQALYDLAMAKAALDFAVGEDL